MDKENKIKSPAEPKKPLLVELVNGHPLHFIVESGSAKIQHELGETWRNHAHNVRLDEYRIIIDEKVVYCGSCSCGHWTFRLHPKFLDRGIFAVCEHLKAAREFRLNDWITKYMEKHEK